MLSADPGEETNRLLRLLVQGKNNSTITSDAIGPPPFTAPSDAVRINQLFSISLTCSMLAAFGALLGQQWITSYRRRPTGGFEEERLERQRRLIGAKRWRLEPILKLVLPMLLQFSVILFLVGMVHYLHSLSSSVALPNAIFFWTGVACIALTILFSLSDPHCPFKTPFSEATSSIFAPSLRSLICYDWASFSPWGGRFARTLDTSKLGAGRKVEWLLHLWPKDFLLGHSMRRILATSSDATTLFDMALNIPLLDDEQSLHDIYWDDVAMLHLHHLYETCAIRSAAPESVYSAAICHLVLAAGEGSPERTNHLLQGQEVRILLAAAQANVSYLSHTIPIPIPIPIPHSSIMTVAVASILSEENPGDNTPTDDASSRRYTELLLQSFHITASPAISIAVMAWTIITSPKLTPDARKRVKARNDLGFHPLRDDGRPSDSDFIWCASEAYRVLCKPRRYVSMSFQICTDLFIDFPETVKSLM